MFFCISETFFIKRLSLQFHYRFLLKQVDLAMDRLSISILVFAITYRNKLDISPILVGFWYHGLKFKIKIFVGFKLQHVVTLNFVTLMKHHVSVLIFLFI